MAPRHREGRGRHGGSRSGGRSFAVHAPREARRLSSGDTAGTSSSVRPSTDEAAIQADAAEQADVRPAGPVTPSEVPSDSPSGVLTSASPNQQRAPGPAARTGATPAQLRRFIKSRPYVPLHELRRRFGLNGHEDEVVCIDLPDGRAWVGLPADEGRMLAELVRQGEVGCELSIDPTSPVVVGVFPMRPVALGRSPAAAATTPANAERPAEQQTGSLSAP